MSKPQWRNLATRGFNCPRVPNLFKPLCYAITPLPNYLSFSIMLSTTVLYLPICNIVNTDSFYCVLGTVIDKKPDGLQSIATRHSKSLDQLLRSTVTDTPMLSLPLHFSKTINNNNSVDRSKYFAQKQSALMQNNTRTMTLPRRLKQNNNYDVEPPEFRIQPNGYASLPLRRNGRRSYRPAAVNTTAKIELTNNYPAPVASANEKRLPTNSGLKLKKSNQKWIYL